MILLSLVYDLTFLSILRSAGWPLIHACIPEMCILQANLSAICSKPTPPIDYASILRSLVFRAVCLPNYCMISKAHRCLLVPCNLFSPPLRMIDLTNILAIMTEYEYRSSYGRHDAQCTAVHKLRTAVHLAEMYHMYIQRT